ncbi:phage protein [Pseudomonas chlororaphis]|uniref:phage protein n=1 Tax=Pseudomonas chlororaphis TaxID=587753 RepID=UPI0005F94F6F|nr:phage protein [Pseudomonas chlororaphis]
MSAPAVKPSSSTLRVVEWDDLPPSVKQIPSDYNPIADGILMAHQADWLSIHAQIKLCEKGRRTGITFAEALDSVITAASRKAAGGMDVFYVGDTKEKGLEFIGYCAKFSRVMAEAQASGVSEIEEFLFEDQDESGNTRQINAYRIRYASGFKIVALSSNPANLRGLQGKVIIDEAAFHRDVSAVLDAATALLIWGGRIVIISSHNGKSNPFNQMVNDIREGRYGDTAEVYKATFDDAVANGLYERKCMMTGEAPTAEGKEAWYKQIRNAYGPRKAQMHEELDAIPRDGNGICVPGVWIEDAMREARTVLRLALDDDFALQSLARREAYVEDWIERYLAPLVQELTPELRHYLGMDYARHRDFSIICPMSVDQARHRDVPFVVEMHKVPYRQQKQILFYILRRLPRFACAALDATGSGETLAEEAADEFGHDRILQVKLSRAWYGAWMPKFIQLFEDGTITMPKDDSLQQDVRSIEVVDGIPMITKARSQDLKDPELYRHGDFAGAGSLANYATLESAAGPVSVKSRRPRQGTRITQGYA